MVGVSYQSNVWVSTLHGYPPIYLIDMIHLPEDDKTAFMKGEFSVHETCGSFKGTASDIATEHKIKELKGLAGLKYIAKK